MNKKITELKNSLSSKLDTMTTNQIIELINSEDSKISLVIKELTRAYPHCTAVVPGL